MAEAARVQLPYPEAAVIDEETLAAQSLALARELPDRPIVVGGCCCAHIGAVEGLAARSGSLGLVWFDAHGDLNTPESSPSGNLWGMPLRMLLDSGAIEPANTILLGSRNLDPPEQEYVESSGLRTDRSELDQALEGTDGVYVALDVDSLEPGEISPFMPEPGGLAASEVEEVLRRVQERSPILGAGFSGLAAELGNVKPLTRFCSALGL